MKSADPTRRVVAGMVQRDQANSRRRLQEPFATLDRTGFIDREDLGRAELSAWRRLSPRHRRDKTLADFDDRVGELERQLAEQGQRIAGLLERQRAVPERDADALAAWHLQDRNGPRPDLEAEALGEKITTAETDRDGLQRAVEQVLAEKARWVDKHRDKLLKDDARATADARATVEASVAAWERAREALVTARQDELWTLTYPSAAAGREPYGMHTLARSLDNRLRRAGVTTAIDAVSLGRLLREDADALATAIDPEQSAALDGRDPNKRPSDAVWADSAEGEAQRKRDRDAAIQRYTDEWGRPPSW